MICWDEFSIWLTQPEQGYKFPLRVDNERYAALYQRLYGWSICVGDIGDRYGFNEEYSYSSTDAVLALIEWAARDFDGQPIGWVRHTQQDGPTERRAPP
jgi:hypothetical protein